MAKRFTDTEIWKKKWFRELSPKMKIAWSYLKDTCDHAGVWDADFDLMKFFIGDEVTVEEIEKAFHGRILRLQEGKKYLLLGFISFQYVSLKKGNRTHDSARMIINAVAPDIDPDSLSVYPKPYHTLSKGYPNSSLTSEQISEALSEVSEGLKDTDTDKGSDKDTGLESEPFGKVFVLSPEQAK